MLKHEELILRMSLHQRIRLITSSKTDENCGVEDYEFPIFHFYPNPSLKTAEKYATFFPSDKALAATWDRETVKNVYECTGNEAKANKEYAYFGITNNLSREGVSEDAYLAAQFLKQKAAGLKKSGVAFNLDDHPATSNKAVLFETAETVKKYVISEGASSVRVYNVNAVEELKKTYGYDGCVFGVASTKEDAARYISSGCTLVFTVGAETEGLEDFLFSLTEKYIKSKAAYDAGEINLTEFDRRVQSGDILDEQAVNAACDRMIDLLLRLKESGAASVEEQCTRAGKSEHTPLFNEVYHDKLAYYSAQHSVVLLKNNNSVLPLGRGVKVAVIGEYATNNDYRITNKNIPTLLHRPFDEISGYKYIDAVGYAHGYCAGEIRRLDLIETALNLCDEAKLAIVYLCAPAGSVSIPAGQGELLDALYRKGVKIIAVVSADRAIDTSFADKCEAVLFDYGAGQGSAQAVFDILTGAISPSGKLVDTFCKDYGAVSAEEGVPAYCSIGASNVRYPFGFGLSYAKFEYRNLKLTERGASCTVTNRGDIDAYCTVMAFVRRAGARTTLANCVLRGFNKVLVKKGDSVRLEIPFDDDTFRVYDAENDKTFIQGGKYEISLNDNANSVLLSGELDVRERVLSTETVIKPLKSDGGLSFTDGELDKYIRKEKKKLSFGFRLFTALILVLYYDAMGVGLLVSNLIADKTLALYLITGVLLAVGNVLALVYVIILCKRRKLQKYLHPNEVLTDMVDGVKEFEEVAKVSYIKPVESTVLEFNPSDDEEDEQAEEEKVRRYDATFAEDEEEVEFSKKVSFSELCNAFRVYAANRGISVEISSVRSLLAGMASGKAVILGCKNADLLPALKDAVCEYFGIYGRASASDEWSSLEDLLWKKGESAGDYVLSDISNGINLASKTPEKCSFIMLENVSAQNFSDYFSTFLDYANFPSEEHFIKFSEDVTLKIPENLCFLIVPSGDITEELTPAAAHACLFVEIIASACPPANVEEEIKVMSRGDIGELVAEAREQFFVDEKVWKKLDEFTEAVSANERFAIDNKSLLQLEKYTSILLECGADENEAITEMFIAKILLLIKASKVYRREDGGRTVYGIIEKLFTDENLSGIQRALIPNV